ncbi:MAG: ATP phosphoribosyltransferase [Proteobacteria bacterium]|nr:ATP phosphoribosyltransferase [Pseudomonadota bacterium]
MNSAHLRIAIQKSGRLSEKCRELLAQAGISFESRADRLISRAKEQPIDLMLVRDDDIPGFVSNSVSQLGIVGLNVLEEKLEKDQDGKSEVEIIRRLGFGSCRLALALPKAVAFEGLSSLSGKRIASSYPKTLQRYLDAHGIVASIVEMSGSVELAPSIGIADAICDLVSTGATLESNGLRECTVLLESEAVLIRPRGELSREQEQIIERLLARFEGLGKAKNAKYIMMNAPKDAIYRISQLIPGMERPTVMPLMYDDARVAIHAVAKENVFWETIEKLKEAGASSILVLPIEKIIE